jgi:hypothetical protein
MIEIKTEPALSYKIVTITNVQRIIISKLDGQPDTARGIHIQTDLGTELVLSLIPEKGKEIEVI